MLRTIILLLLLLPASELYAQHDLAWFRKNFYKQPTTEATLQMLMVADFDKGSPEESEILAYKAVAKTMMAEYSFSPFRKISYFNSGKDELEEQIAASTTFEKVYLRLLVQLNIPKFLGYSDSIMDDINFLQQSIFLKELSNSERQWMLESLLASKNAIKYNGEIKKIFK